MPVWPLGSRNSRGLRTGLLTLVAFIIFFFTILASITSGSPGPATLGFFLFFTVILITIIANATQRPSRIQRPYTEQTAFMPPPPPDTVLVKCDYCMTSQTFKEKCENCGAPLPKPGFN